MIGLGLEETLLQYLRAVGWSVTAAVGFAFGVGIALKVFDYLSTDIDEWEEIKKGNIGVISKSGTLTYEAIDQLVKNNLGQTTALGIGGDPIIGTDMRKALQLFEDDDETKGIVLIGEIGGTMEIEAAKWAKDNATKPIVGFIAGQTAPPGRRMGHAGAIISGGDETAIAKMKIMKECGIHVWESPSNIGKKMKEVIKE